MRAARRGLPQVDLRSVCGGRVVQVPRLLRLEQPGRLLQQRRLVLHSGGRLLEGMTSVCEPMFLGELRYGSTSNNRRS